MLHQFIGADRRADFDHSAQAVGKTLTTGAASYTLRVSLERLHALIADDNLEAWAFYAERGTVPTHFMVSAASVVAWGLKCGMFRAAADAQHLVTTEEFEVLAVREQYDALKIQRVGQHYGS